MLVGPSVPISRTLFNYGVDQIAGLVASDPAQILEAVKLSHFYSLSFHTYFFVIPPATPIKLFVFLL
ncbi:Rossmann-like domain-containing protein [Dehalobacter sp. DCM]|uniref:Rossmann-like domain-containing protein n=1 Tax=Dehalobacter sp. DCM TaxID=2907827 RepID=UPI003FCC453C